MFKKMTLSIFVSLTVCSVYSMEKVALQKEETQKVLIFDLGGIYFDLSHMGFVSSAGWGLAGEFFSHLWQGENPAAAIEERYFEILKQFPVQAPAGFKPACTNKGRPMPYLQCAYQAGRMTSKEILKMWNDPENGVYEKLKAEGYFSGEREAQMFKGIVEGVFTPDVHETHTYQLAQAVALLEEIAALKNDDGTKKYTIVALSNWDKESFELVKKRFPKVFSWFDYIFISADLGSVKPNDEVYERVIAALEKAGYIKQNFTFFDDQKENVDASTALGIQSVHVKRGNAQSLASALSSLGILPEKPAKSFFLGNKNTFVYSAFALGGLSVIAYGLWAAGVAS